MNRHIVILDENKVVNFAGGIENVICAMANEFVRRGDRVTIVCFDVEKGMPLFPLDSRVDFVNLAFSYGKPFNDAAWFFKKLEKELLRTFCGSKMTIFGRPVKDPKREYFEHEFIRRLRSLIQESSPSVFLSVTPTSAWLAQQAMKGGKQIPVIGMCHTDPLNSGEIKTQRQIDAWKRCAKVQVLLPPFVSMVRDMGIEKIVQIPNCVKQIPDDQVADLSECHHRILSVGRIEGASKRQHLLVEAFALIAKRYPDWRVELYGSIGNKGYMKRLQKLIVQCGLEKQVLLKGVSHSIPEILRQSDFIVFTSRYEGFSIALTEAMSIGLPVIAYRSCCSIAAMVEDGVNGLLAEDSPESLASAMARLMDHPDLRVQMGVNARTSMNQYAPEIVWNRWDNLLDEVLEEKRQCN